MIPDFKKLIEKNDDAENNKILRLREDASKLYERANKLVEQLDGDMLLALSKYGNVHLHAYLSAEWLNGYRVDVDNNSLTILVSDKASGSRPDTVLVLSGSYGIRRYKDLRSDMIAFGIDKMERSSYRTTSIDANDWTESGCDPRKLPDVTMSDCCPLEYPIRPEDKRDWFTRVNDIIPHFMSRFSDYLEERANLTK